ncbi:MAG: UDP-N-acetylmuramoyl-L-alanine--D-glutamate ligase [Oscillospiraceae bacterium]|nr:UDP-N-acetylmuramoyl-L-alanine--D-glutamate ligase [Oscillospiraceae bacterium]
MDRLERYLENLRGRRVLVLGLGVSNRPLVRLLLAHGAEVTGCDRRGREDLEAETLALEDQGLRLRLGASYLEDLSGDVAFRTPGLHPDRPELARLRAQGTVMTSEMEVFFEVCPCTAIAVTGSDGKTTTTTLISEILKEAGRTVWVGGNIGRPLLPLADRMGPEDVAVVELSSFQLLDMVRSPHVAVVTNLAPNHLDVHRDMAEYVAAKENVYLHQGPGDVAVFNADNAITHGFCPKAAGKVLEFSRRTRPAAGVYLENGVIYRAGGEKLLEQAEISLPGIHNVENYMAAICAVEGLVSDEDIRGVARRFQGVEHRIELVRTRKGVRFYNDSIASSPSRTIAGLRSFPEKLILIAGGYDKHIPYDDLGPEIAAHVKTLVLTGATAPKIRRAVEDAPGYAPGAPEIVEIEDFYEAIRTAAALARPGDVVMLSPASASFDHFRNFMVRGDAFKKTVMEL